MARSLTKGVSYLLYVGVVTTLLLELTLRLYNPISPRIKGDRIILPVRQRYEVQIDALPGVQPKALHTKNSLGFRGPEPPADWAAHLTVIAVGGSTTECYFLNDGTDWPAVLSRRLRPRFAKLWVNNAGLNGHSTFGHQILLDDHVRKLHPDVVLFLVGINELGRDQLSGFDGHFLLDGPDQRGNADWRSIARKALNNSEVLNTLRVISRGIRTQKMHFRDNAYVRFNPRDTTSTPPGAVAARRRELRPKLAAYARRLHRMLDTCQRAGIAPVLLTQPLLLGQGTDPLTGTDLAKFRMWNGETGTLYWAHLDAYNDVTRAVARQRGVPLIDLARRMPRSTAYFYDEMHYTERGAARVAEIVATDLERYLRGYLQRTAAVTH
jgi:lysophospholipase L1-like esterase